MAILELCPKILQCDETLACIAGSDSMDARIVQNYRPYSYNNSLGAFLVAMFFSLPVSYLVL